MACCESSQKALDDQRKDLGDANQALFSYENKLATNLEIKAYFDEFAGGPTQWGIDLTAAGVAGYYASQLQSATTALAGLEAAFAAAKAANNLGRAAAIAVEAALQRGVVIGLQGIVRALAKGLAIAVALILGYYAVTALCAYYRGKIDETRKAIDRLRSGLAALEKQLADCQQNNCAPCAKCGKFVDPSSITGCKGCGGGYCRGCFRRFIEQAELGGKRN